jgi:hypothetical protein
MIPERNIRAIKKSNHRSIYPDVELSGDSEWTFATNHKDTRFVYLISVEVHF